MASLVQPGFAIRREKTCLSGLEVDCGSTGVDGFRGCCPSSLVCDPKARNRYCCPPDDDSCTESVLAAKPEPPCANATWDLFENGGYYCCEHGVQAYDRSDTNWCGKPSGSRAATMEVVTLSLLREGVDPATMISTSSSIPSSLAASSATPPASSVAVTASSSATSSSSSLPASSSESSSPSVGAIAGGVVGGIFALSLLIFLTWFLLRRRRQAHAAPELNGDTHNMPHEKYASTSASGGAIYEAGEHESRMPAAEMAGHSRPVELNGTSAMR